MKPAYFFRIRIALNLSFEISDAGHPSQRTKPGSPMEEMQWGRI
jgi:hypothetical protein